MKTSTMVAIGAGVAIGAFFLLRSGPTATLMTPAGPVQVPAQTFSASAVASAMQQRSEQMIQNLMTRSHLTRAQAEARYAQLVPSVTAALTPTSGFGGFGGYYRA